MAKRPQDCTKLTRSNEMTARENTEEHENWSCNDQARRRGGGGGGGGSRGSNEPPLKINNGGRKI